MSQSAKVDSFGAFSQQKGTLLSSKELDQAEFLCEGALSSLKEGLQGDPKSVLAKFVVSFLKLFACCPANFYDGLVKKYLSILREVHFLKVSNNVKYEYLIPALLEAAQSKYYPSFAVLMKAQKSQPHPNLKELLLDLCYIQGGTSLGNFLQLFKKALDKDKETATKAEQYLSAFFSGSVFTVSAAIERWNNPKQSFDVLTYTFRLFVLEEIQKDLSIKFGNLFEKEISRVIEHYLNSSNCGPKTEAEALVILRAVRNNKITSQIKNNREELACWEKCYVRDVILCYFILYHQFVQEREKIQFWKILFILKNRSVLKKNNISDVSDLLEVFSLELIQNLSFYSADKMNKRIHPFQLINMILSYSSQIIQDESKVIQNSFQLYQSIIFQRLSLPNFASPKLTLYLTSLFWKLLTFQINDQTILTSHETRLCLEIKKIVEKVKIEQEVIEQLYFSLSLTLTFEKYRSLIFPTENIEQQIQHSSMWAKVNEIIRNYCCNDLSESQMRQKIDNQTENISHMKFTFQHLLDFLSALFHPQKGRQPDYESKEKYDCPFSLLSQVLINKLNIRPVQKDKNVPQLTFVSRSSSLFIKAAQYLIIRLYQKDNLLRANFFFMKTLPQNDFPSNEKIVLLTIKKYIGIAYHKPNQIVLRKMIANREYFLIWCMLISNYKVRTLFEQMNRCGIGAEQLGVFLNVEKMIIKEFTQYYVSKDRYKFRLILWQKSLVNQTYLLDTSIADLLIANYFKDQEKLID